MTENSTVKKQRNANIELLRILSMMMVIILHGLDKGGQLTNIFSDESNASAVAWILESLSIGAVNIYMMITGYFLVKTEFKSGRIFELICQIMFYSAGAIFVLDMTGIYKMSGLSRYEWFITGLPVHMNEYWFASSYVLLYLLSPVLVVAVKNMEKKQHLAVIILLLICESVAKSISPIALAIDDKGYSVFWFITVFLIAAYFSKYGFGWLQKSWRGLLVYVVAAFLIFMENLFLQYKYYLAGSFELIQGVSYHYNHILVILMAVGIFAAFANAKRINGFVATAICAISPLSFGVYLLHEQYQIRFLWTKWVGLNDTGLNWSGLLVQVFIGVVAVYAVGTLVDLIRKLIFDGVKALSRKAGISRLFVKLDNIVNGREG